MPPHKSQAGNMRPISHLHFVCRNLCTWVSVEVVFLHHTFAFHSGRFKNTHAAWQKKTHNNTNNSYAQPTPKYIPKTLLWDNGTLASRILDAARALRVVGGRIKNRNGMPRVKGDGVVGGYFLLLLLFCRVTLYEWTRALVRHLSMCVARNNWKLHCVYRNSILQAHNESTVGVIWFLYGQRITRKVYG